MKRVIFIFIALACCSALHAQNTTAQPAKATTPIIEYGSPIPLEVARKLMAAAKQEALNNGWTMAIAIVDCGGNLVLFEKMDNTQIASIDVAMGKAKTANNFKRSSKLLEDVVAAGGSGLKLLSIPTAFCVEGGEPVMAEGKIIGAIGVSGMQSGQDGQVARAALAALKK